MWRAIVLILVIDFIILAVTSNDLKMFYKYNHAKVCKGTIVNSLGIENIYVPLTLRRYAHTSSHWDRSHYERYTVEYMYHGEKHWGEVLHPTKGLENGKKIKIRVYEHDNLNELISVLYPRRCIRRFGYMFAFLVFVSGWILYFALQ